MQHLEKKQREIKSWNFKKTPCSFNTGNFNPKKKIIIIAKIYRLIYIRNAAKTGGEYLSNIS